MRSQQKFHPVAIDLRMEALLRALVEAAHPRAAYEAWHAAGESLPEARAIAIAFENAPLADAATTA